MATTVAEVLSQLGDWFSAFIDLVLTGVHALGVQGLLIVLTLVVTCMSYMSQKRAGIREAIEQLDPRHIEYRVFDLRQGMGGSKPTHKVQVKAGLDSVDFLQGEAQIAFFTNQIDSVGDRIVKHSVPPYYLSIPKMGYAEKQPLVDRIIAHELIESVNRDDNQITVTCSTRDPVQCRQVASHVLDCHSESYRNQINRVDFWPHHR